MYPFKWVDEIRIVIGVQRPGGAGLISLQYATPAAPTVWGSLDGIGGPGAYVNRYPVADSGWKSVSSTIRTLAMSLDPLDHWMHLRIVGEAGTVGITTMFGLIQVYAR
jgi:hypothetical protein